MTPIFDKRKQFMGYEVVRSYYRTREVEGFGTIKLLTRIIMVDGKPRKTMPFTSQAIAFYRYQDDRDLLGHNSPLYQELKFAYPDCTPHHDVDGYYIVPTPIHQAFRHFGTIGTEKRNRAW